VPDKQAVDSEYMFAPNKKNNFITLVILSGCLAAPAVMHGDEPPDRLSIGRPASAADIARWDIDIGPDGAGLPTGSGTAQQGEPVYAEKCASCHGPDGKRGRNKLAGSPGEKGKRTVGNYWPYATTLFDYIRRAMPPSAPGSLHDTEVYALTAYILHLNSIIAADMQINADSLANIDMPARDRFIPDDRRGGAEVR